MLASREVPGERRSYLPSRAGITGGELSMAEGFEVEPHYLAGYDCCHC